MVNGTYNPDCPDPTITKFLGNNQQQTSAFDMCYYSGGGINPFMGNAFAPYQQYNNGMCCGNCGGAESRRFFNANAMNPSAVPQAPINTPAVDNTLTNMAFNSFVGATYCQPQAPAQQVAVSPWEQALMNAQQPAQNVNPYVPQMMPQTPLCGTYGDMSTGLIPNPINKKSIWNEQQTTNFMVPQINWGALAPMNTQLYNTNPMATTQPTFPMTNVFQNTQGMSTSWYDKAVSTWGV